MVFKRVINVKQALLKVVVTLEQTQPSAFFRNLFAAFFGQKTVFHMAPNQTGVEKSIRQL